jgi:hypothetical protein
MFQLASVACAVLLAGGCGNTQDDAVETVAQRFYSALSDGDGAAVCAVLATRTRDEVEQSEGKPCADAILDEDLPQPGGTERVSTFGTSAQVRYFGETTFLSRFKDGWRVVAASCSPAPGDRYDCLVEAG